MLVSDSRGDPSYQPAGHGSASLKTLPSKVAFIGSGD